MKRRYYVDFVDVVSPFVSIKMSVFSTGPEGIQGPFRASCRTLSLGAPGVFSLGPLQRPVLFLRQKENGGLGALPLGRRKKRGLWPQKKVRPRLRRGMISASMRCFKRCGLRRDVFGPLRGKKEVRLSPPYRKIFPSKTAVFSKNHRKIRKRQKLL